MSVLERKELEQSPLADLHALASDAGIEGYRKLRRGELIEAILAGRHSGEEVEVPADQADDSPDAPVSDQQADPAPQQDLCWGVLDILPNGSGFIRAEPFVHSPGDIYISPAQIRRCELRAGDVLEGPVRSPRRSERYASLVRVERVNSRAAEPPPARSHFDELTPRFATERFASLDGLVGVAIGKGSRVAIGGAPGAGATTLLRRITQVLVADDRLELVVVLAGVRPEEVPEWRDSFGTAVAGGACDHSVDEQAQVADLAVERAKRAVEQGRDAVVVIDSLDALPTGVARRVFSAARNTAEGGSLSVLAVADPYGELQRLATTRIVLDVTATDLPAVDTALSQTMRAELLG